MFARFRYALLALIAPISPLAVPAAQSELQPLEIQEIRTVRRESPRYPATMRALGVKEGRVSLIVSVDEAGSVQDVLVADSSRRAFADSALKSIQNWSFEPARYNGQPFPSSLRVDIDFELGANLQWQTFTAPVETNVAQNNKRERPVTSRSLRELDTIPLPLELVEPQATAPAQATVEFYIDELGNARCPKLLNADNLEFGRETLEAIAQWKFQPPVASGLRTNAVVRQTFQYANGRFATTKPQ